MSRPVRFAIRRITVSAGSALDARRLADGLPAAIEDSLRRLIDGSPAPTGVPTAAERAAAEIAAALAPRLEPFR